jgi:hypothetical protein
MPTILAAYHLERTWFECTVEAKLRLPRAPENRYLLFKVIWGFMGFST